MNFSQLTMFMAVAQSGSVSAAARQLHRVPSNITTRIKQLEEDLGAALFIRENNRLRLSPSGHTLQQYGEKILALAQEARQAISGDAPEGNFPLGALESAAAVRIPGILARFNQEYPRVQLQLSTGASGAMLDSVLEGTLSAAFIDGPILHPAIDGVPVFDEEMVIIAPKTHKLFTRAADIDGVNIYAFRTNCSYRRHFESWFSADRAKPGKIYEMESYHGMLACVVAGAGIAMLPRSMLNSMPGHERVEVFVPEERWRWLTTWLIWRRNVVTPQLEAFTRLLPER